MATCDWDQSVKVAFFIRANHQEVGGGDLTQIYSTAEGLRKLGVEIQYFSDTSADLAPFDLVHCFNSPRFEETQSFFTAALHAHKSIAFSTIFWSKEEQAVGIAKLSLVARAHATFGLGPTKYVWGKFKNTQARFRGEQSRKIEKWLFQKATILLPNSESEERELEKTYHLSHQKYHPVRNAIRVEDFKQVPTQNRRDYVLSVGRIERRKNTKKLILACAELKLQLVLIGGAEAKDDYVQECLVLMKKYGFQHHSHMSQAELRKFYYEAKVHALVGWYETPGLSNLEAACGGCSILSTDRGSTREYFRDKVVYCDPFSQQSVTKGLEKVWHRGNTGSLRDYILKHYTWDLAAKDTLKAYREIAHE